jgi:hypothetical protein
MKNRHVDIVAALHIAVGALTLMGAVVVFVFLGMAGGIAGTQGETEAARILAVIALAVGGFLVLLALSSIVGGWALMAGYSWVEL